MSERALAAPREAFDLIVFGSGAAGLTCAATAALAGLRTLVVEKRAQCGGTTALSGGVMWIPASTPARRAGFDDSPERALAYLTHHVGGRTSAAKLASFVEWAPRMLDELCAHGVLEVAVFDGFSDYHAESPGGALNGRSVEMG
jgi:3-oxosteroid 1-dehydrogenase